DLIEHFVVPNLVELRHQLQALGTELHIRAGLDAQEQALPISVAFESVHMRHRALLSMRGDLDLLDHFGSAFFVRRLRIQTRGPSSGLLAAFILPSTLRSNSWSRISRISGINSRPSAPNLTSRSASMPSSNPFSMPTRSAIVMNGIRFSC